MSIRHHPDDATLVAYAAGAVTEGISLVVAAHLDLCPQCRARVRDATDLGVRPGADGPAFTLAFLDPPYGRGLGATALACLREGGWLAPGTLAVLETGAGEPTPETPGFTLLDARTWGAAKVWFLQLEGGEG